jgi:hypothetical protein
VFFHWAKIASKEGIPVKWGFLLLSIISALAESRVYNEKDAS